MTQQQARLRSDYQAPDFDIERIDLTFHLHPHQTRVRNRIQVVPKQQQKPLILDGVKLHLEQVSLNGRVLSEHEFEVTDRELIIPKVPNDAFELQIDTEIDPANNKALEGLYQSGGAYCTQCEAEGFRRITYYLDRPDVLTLFTTTIHADAKAYPYLLSNGNKIAEGVGENGEHWVTWSDPFPKPAYLFALVAGDFEVLEDSYQTQSGRNVALQVFVDAGNKDRAKHAMLSLKNSMRWDEERFGLEYDLDIYMIVAVDFFNMGAMENKGLNVFNSRYVLADAATATDQDFLNVESVIGHEYFHNWTGNRITCRDWFQLSLKEGLTVFRDQEFSADLGSRAVNRIQDIRVIRTHQFNEDASPMAHPIRPDKVVEMNNFYTVTVYNKGAEVIRMLHTLLGEKQFQAGMKLYIERHDGQAVTCDDFVAAMADANQRDLSVFKRWYSQAGTPVVKVTESYDSDKQEYQLSFAQHTPDTPEQTNKLPVHIPILLSAYDAKGNPLVLDHPQVQQHESGSLLFELTEAQATLSFSQVAQQPILACLENFSAPVRVQQEQSTSDRLVLMAHAKHEVTRWEAAQQIYTQVLLDAIKHDTKVVLAHEVQAALVKLAQAPLDPALKALALTPPAAEEIAEYFEQSIPLEGIEQSCNALREAIAEALFSCFEQVWQQRQQGSYVLASSAIANRAWQNVALYYLALHKPETYSAEVAAYFFAADNMTNQQAALEIAVQAELPCKTELLAAFEQQWQAEPLVLDKWFAVQASSPADNCIEQVRELANHERFNTDNPNRIYSLYAVFTRNIIQFNRKDGAGYRWVAAMITYLNDKNPQVASRLITPFLQWQRFDETRQNLMREQLIILKSLPNLATDLEEKIGHALAASDTNLTLQ